MGLFQWTVTLHSTAVEDLLRQGYPMPTVLYVNKGLWILHMEPTWPWTTGYKAWENYETSLQETVQSYRQVAPQATIVIMNTHSVCEDAYDGDYAQIIELYRSNRSVAAMPCVERLSKMGYFHNDIEGKCIKGFRVSENSQLLNLRLQEAIGAFKNVEIVDAYAITHQQCSFTSDGVHYNLLVLEELNYFFHQLQWLSR